MWKKIIHSGLENILLIKPSFRMPGGFRVSYFGNCTFTKMKHMEYAEFFFFLMSLA